MGNIKMSSPLSPAPRQRRSLYGKLKRNPFACVAVLIVGLLILAWVGVFVTQSVLAASGNNPQPTNTGPNTDDFPGSPLYTLSNTYDVNGSGFITLAIFRPGPPPKNTIDVVVHIPSGVYNGRQQHQGDVPAQFYVASKQKSTSYIKPNTSGPDKTVTLHILPGDWTTQGNGQTVKIHGRLQQQSRSSDDHNHMNFWVHVQDANAFIGPNNENRFGLTQSVDCSGSCNPRKYTLEFAPSCNDTDNKNDVAFVMHDMDVPNPNIQPGPLPVTIKDMTDGSTVNSNDWWNSQHNDKDDPNLQKSGNDAYYFFHFTPQHKYRVIMDNVFNNNVLQMQIPFDSANYEETCPSPPSGRVTQNVCSWNQINNNLGNFKYTISATFSGSGSNNAQLIGRGGQQYGSVKGNSPATWNFQAETSSSNKSNLTILPDGAWPLRLQVGSGNNWTTVQTINAPPCGHVVASCSATPGMFDFSALWFDADAWPASSSNPYGSQGVNGQLKSGGNTVGGYPGGVKQHSQGSWTAVKINSWPVSLWARDDQGGQIPNNADNNGYEQVDTVPKPSCGNSCSNIDPSLTGTLEPNQTFTAGAMAHYQNAAAAKAAYNAGTRVYVSISGPVSYPEVQTTSAPTTKDLTVSQTFGPTYTPGNYTLNYGLHNPEVSCQMNFQIAYIPYFNIVGGDTAAGAGFAGDAGSGSNCSQHGDANIESWNNDNSPGGDYTGAGTQYAAQALGDISSFVTTSNAEALSAGNGISNVGTPLNHPYNLSFGNYSSSGGIVPPPDDNTNFGGQFASLPCIPDYTGQYSASGVPNNTGPINYNVSGTYVQTGTLTINHPAAIAANVHLIIIVKGNVYIQSNLTYSYGSPQQVPSIAVYATGNILVDHNVNELHGTFVAEGGNFATCATSATSDTTLWDNCQTRLDIYGAVAAKNFRLERSLGSLNAGQGPSESFHYGPELWLPTGSSCLVSGTPCTYDSITGLPPVL